MVFDIDRSFPSQTFRLYHPLVNSKNPISFPQKILGCNPPVLPSRSHDDSGLCHTTSIFGKGNKRWPPEFRYSCSLSAIPFLKCHGSTMKYSGCISRASFSEIIGKGGSRNAS